jgi:hypothetical protein
MAAGKAFSDADVSSIFDDLCEYNLEMVLAAIRHYRKSAKFAPTAYDIVQLLEAHNKRPSADEVWASLPASEFETVVWTQESAEAYAIAYELIIGGDKIAARMAFKGAYERLCNESALIGRKVAWLACIGYDKSKIEPALMKAVVAGRITQDRANKYLPAPADSGLIAGLLTGKVTELPANNENLKKHWNGLGQALKAVIARMAEEEKRQAQLDAVEIKLHGAMHR